MSRACTAFKLLGMWFKLSSRCTLLVGAHAIRTLRLDLPANKNTPRTRLASDENFYMHSTAHIFGRQILVR